MLTKKDVEDIVKRISMRKSCLNLGWELKIEEMFRNIPPTGIGFGTMELAGFTVTPSFRRPDTLTGEIETGFGGAMFIPVNASETNAIMKVWQAFCATADHEMMEAFQYMGKQVFNPHKTVDELVYPEVLDPEAVMISVKTADVCDAEDAIMFVTGT